MPSLSCGGPSAWCAPPACLTPQLPRTAAYAASCMPAFCCCVPHTSLNSHSLLLAGRRAPAAIHVPSAPLAPHTPPCRATASATLAVCTASPNPPNMLLAVYLSIPPPSILQGDGQYYLGFVNTEADEASKRSVKYRGAKDGKPDTRITAYFKALVGGRVAGWVPFWCCPLACLPACLPTRPIDSRPLSRPACLPGPPARPALPAAGADGHVRHS